MHLWRLGLRCLSRVVSPLPVPGQTGAARCRGQCAVSTQESHLSFGVWDFQGGWSHGHTLLCGQ